MLSAFAFDAAPGAQAIECATDYESPEAAYESGREAQRGGDSLSAICAHEFAASKGIFLAKFYLAEILSDTNNIYGDPTRAFDLYSEIIRSNRDVDPHYDYRAQFVARSYVMISRYLSGDLIAGGVKRSDRQARRLLGYAATYFDDANAQYGFARMLLDGRGGVRNVRSGKHYLSSLSRQGHAGAQGYLAELFWIGKHVERRHDYALALSTMAVRNAPREDRIWIGELHHEISCSADANVQAKARKLITRWTARYRTKRIYPKARNDVFSGGSIEWSCAEDGSAEEPGAKDGEDHGALGTVAASDRPDGGTSHAERDRLRAMHGTMFGFGKTEATIPAN
ncbi:MAG: tetratricopeptide repeat protein [Hyphomicrobiaceae bacterium]